MTEEQARKQLAQIESEMKEKIARIKICPLLSIKRYPRDGSADCLREACAWWVNMFSECSIKVAAMFAAEELDRRLR
jgi:hypothetical protein